MQQHIVHQHGQITGTPGHIGKFCTAPLLKLRKRLRKRNSLFLQVLIPDTRQGSDTPVHFGVVLRTDIQPQLVHGFIGIIQLHGTDLDDLTAQIDRVPDNNVFLRRLVPFQIKNNIVHLFHPFFKEIIARMKQNANHDWDFCLSFH